MGIFRIVMGFILLCDLWQDYLDAPALFTREGGLPRTLWARMYEYTGVWSIHLYNDSVVGVRLLLAVQIAIALCFLVGYRTRLATFLTWLLFVSLLNRNLIATDGGDQIASYLFFCGIFLPLGARYSVDSRREWIEANDFFGVGSFLVVSQMMWMYLFAGLAKLMTDSWWAGEALDITLRWTEYTRPFAEAVRSQPWLTRLTTRVTPWFELLAPFLFLFHGRGQIVRTLGLLAFALLHLSIDATLRLTFFSAYSAAGLVALLPTDVWDFIGRKIRGLAPISPPSARVASYSLSRATKGVAVLLAVCSAYSAFPAWLGEERMPYPDWIARINDATFGWQNWNLFREPLRTSGWYRAKALLGNGKTVDLFHNGAEYTEAKPRNTSDQFASRRWQSFIMHAHMQWDETELRRNLARSVAEIWNANHPDDEGVWSLSIVYFREDHPAFLPSVRIDSYEFASFQAEPK